MIDNVQHAVLGGIIRANGGEALDRYIHASSQLTDEHFASYEKACWMLLGRLLSATGVLPDFKIIDHYLPSTQLQVEAQAEVRALWLALEAMAPVEETEFRYAVYMTQELRKKDLFAETLVNAGDILSFGKKIGREEYQGYEDARRHLEDRMLLIDGMEREAMPEGNMRDEREALLEAPMSASLVRLSTGFSHLDKLTGGGFGPGDLVLIAGYTNEGKSFICANMAWYMVMNGHNIVFFTSETVKRDLNLRLIVRHSHLPKFNIPGGLDYSQVRDNSMSPEHFLKYEEVVEDFTNPDAPYGRLDVVQVPEGTTVASLRSKLRAYQAAFHVDGCFIDELQMLAASSKREDSQSELEETVRAALKLSIDFDNGRGIPVFSPWQMKREAWEAARTNGGRYTRASLGNTAEAERRATAIVSAFKHPESQHRVSAQLLKQRNGPTGDFEMHVDFARCLVRAERSALEVELPSMNV